jgi:hypothetical protein
MSETPEIIYPPREPDPDGIDEDYENWRASIGPDPEDEEGEVKFCGGDHKRCL